MPLLTDIAWPAQLPDLFDDFYPETWLKGRYSCPYNMLLLHCVDGPDLVPFIFAPQSNHVDSRPATLTILCYLSSFEIFTDLPCLS
jgi:hypothetical protein